MVGSPGRSLKCIFCGLSWTGSCCLNDEDRGFFFIVFTLFFGAMISSCLQPLAINLSWMSQRTASCSPALVKFSCLHHAQYGPDLMQSLQELITDLEQPSCWHKPAKTIIHCLQHTLKKKLWSQHQFSEYGMDATKSCIILEFYHKENRNQTMHFIKASHNVLQVSVGSTPFIARTKFRNTSLKVFTSTFFPLLIHCCSLVGRNRLYWIIYIVNWTEWSFSCSLLNLPM